jgi:hypothetical protein
MTDQTKNGWVRIQPPRCDLCGRRALWAHPMGGLRCGVCPTPSAEGKKKR